MLLPKTPTRLHPFFIEPSLTRSSAWIADARIGRFWTLHLAIGISTIAHVVLVAASAPGVIVKPDAAFGAFIIGLLTLCVGTGFFKANVSPLLAEQNEDTEMRIETLENGERVIVDPAITNTRIFLVSPPPPPNITKLNTDF